MTIRNGLFSSESVSEGHPDKLADRISDRILDAFLERDPHARVACETMLADQCVIVAGEFKTQQPRTSKQCNLQAESLVREVLRETGYSDCCETGIDPGALRGAGSVQPSVARNRPEALMPAVPETRA